MQILGICGAILRGLMESHGVLDLGSHGAVICGSGDVPSALLCHGTKGLGVRELDLASVRLGRCAGDDRDDGSDGGDTRGLCGSGSCGDRRGDCVLGMLNWTDWVGSSTRRNVHVSHVKDG